MWHSLPITLLIFLSFGCIQAQTCCSGGVPVSSNLGYQSADQGTLQLSLSADFNVLTTLKTGTEKLIDDQRKRTTQSLIVRGAYSFTERLTFEAFIPFVRQTRRINTNAGALDLESTSGIGDPVFLFVYDIIKKGFTFRIGAGPQIPLGSTTERNNRGLILLEDLQPGSGAFDLISLASFEFVPVKRPSALLYLNLIHSSTGVNTESRAGAQTYEFGNDLQIITGFGDQVFVGGFIINPGISFRYRTAQRDLVNVTELPGTGGDFLFSRFSLGIPFPKLNGVFSINIETPLWSKVNETQLAPSYVLNTSWAMTFSKKKEQIPYLEIN